VRKTRVREVWREQHCRQAQERWRRHTTQEQPFHVRQQAPEESQLPAAEAVHWEEVPGRRSQAEPREQQVLPRLQALVERQERTGSQARPEPPASAVPARASTARSDDGQLQSMVVTAQMPPSQAPA
jgi:hypothetical protein